MAYRILKNACYVPEEHRVLGETGGAHRRGWRQRVLPRTRSRSSQPLAPQPVLPGGISGRKAS